MRVNTRYIGSSRGTVTAVVQIDSSRLRKPRLVEYFVFELKKHGAPKEPIDAVIWCCLTQFGCSHLTVTKSGESMTYDRTENSFRANWLNVYHCSFLQ